uniref:Metal-binding protein n=1 Tax=Meloidogyne hapla TaxID=6305 RepID=A0A1I8BG25_MELHA
MKDIKIKLGNKAKCLTIIKETGYFICEVCKNVRYSVFYGAHFLDVEKHFRNGSRHNKAIQGKFN